ncbi:MAG: hypothetical protein ACRCTJ_05595 [Brevinema sp.]
MKKMIIILIMGIPLLVFSTVNYNEEKKASFLKNESSQISKNSVKTFRIYTTSSNYLVTFPLSILPDIGFDKNEIVSISIVRKKYSKTKGKTNFFVPIEWKFKGTKWNTNYEGLISDLETLPEWETYQLSLSSQLMREQNNEGFVLNSKDQSFGIYNALHFVSSNDIIKFVRVHQTNLDPQNLDTNPILEKANKIDQSYTNNSTTEKNNPHIQEILYPNII